MGMDRMSTVSRRRFLTVVGVLGGAWTARVLAGADDVNLAVRFFIDGGAYCCRVAPAGVAMASEASWTVLLLTSRSNRKTRFKMREVVGGQTQLPRAMMAEARRAVTDVWRLDRDREAFFAKFADGITNGRLRSRVVQTGPPTLATMTSDRERAETYLRFADSGATIDFGKAPDLTAEQFHAFLEYFPD